MAHGLSLKVVAEGVERQEQLEFLRAERCDEVQGYLISRPVEASGLAGLLREQENRFKGYIHPIAPDMGTWSYALSRQKPIHVV